MFHIIFLPYVLSKAHAQSFALSSEGNIFYFLLNPGWIARLLDAIFQNVSHSIFLWKRGCQKADLHVVCSTQQHKNN